MIEINLLPKQYLKGSRGLQLGKTGLFVAAGAAAVILMLVGITAFQIYQLGKLEADIAKAQQRAAVLQKDIKLVDALTDVKKKVSNRMTAVERLDRNRSAYVRVLEDIARNVPEFVWLGAYKEKPMQTAAAKNAAKGKKQAADSAAAPVGSSSLPPVRPVEIEGFAFTLNALAAFMINMMRSDYFDDVQLLATSEKKFQDTERAYNFVLSASVHFLSDEELQNLIAASNDDQESTDSQATHRTLN
ncbi:PilN domain-containing protein [bacterium]|nr:PilN domain-containing protein [bacterium]MCB2202356.1 PilN domain-containing protein [bacterium]